MPLDETEEISGGSGVAPSHLPAGTYQLELVDLVKRKMARGQFANPERGESPDDMVTKIELHFQEMESGDVITKLVGFSTAEKSGLYKDVLPALNGGAPGITPGEPITGKLLNGLIGRKCLGAIVVNPKGYAKIGSLLAIPGAKGVKLGDAPAGFAAPPAVTPPTAGTVAPEHVEAFWAVATGMKLDRRTVKAMLKAKFGKVDPALLTQAEYDQALETELDALVAIPF